jgi:hypothetical protein
LIWVGATLTLLAVKPSPVPPSIIQQAQLSLSFVVNTARQVLSLSQPRRQLHGSTVMTALSPAGDQGWTRLARMPNSSAPAGLQPQETTRQQMLSCKHM